MKVVGWVLLAAVALVLAWWVFVRKAKQPSACEQIVGSGTKIATKGKVDAPEGAAAFACNLLGEVGEKLEVAGQGLAAVPGGVANLITGGPQAPPCPPGTKPIDALGAVGALRQTSFGRLGNGQLCRGATG